MLYFFLANYAYFILWVKIFDKNGKKSSTMRASIFAIFSFIFCFFLSPLEGSTIKRPEKDEWFELVPVTKVYSGFYVDSQPPSNSVTRIIAQHGVNFLSSSGFTVDAPTPRKRHETFPPRRKGRYLSPTAITSKLTKLKAGELKDCASDYVLHTAQKPKIIFHAFNKSYQEIISILRNENFKQSGYTHIQISPSQRSMRETIYDPELSEKDKWALRYLPKGYDIDNCYGNEEDLADLIKAANKRGIGLIGDLVFNHVAGLYGFENNHWEIASKNLILYRTLLWKLFSEYEGFSMHNMLINEGESVEFKFINGDKEVYRQCMEDFEDWKDGRWFMGAIPTLKPSPNVIRRHVNYMNTLLRMGFVGFRFDATDHLHPTALAAYVNFLKTHPKKPWFYLEVAEADNGKFLPYTKIAPVTHYPAFHVLKEVFSYHGDLRKLQDIGYNLDEHVIFGETHDTYANRMDPRKGIAAYIEDPLDAELGISAYIVRHGGNPLILSENAQSPFVSAAVTFRRLLNDYEYSLDKTYPAEFYESLYTSTDSNDPRNLIFMLRSGVGLTIFNKSDRKFLIPYTALPLPKEKLIGEFFQIKSDSEISCLKKNNNSSRLTFLFPKISFSPIKTPCLVVQPRSASFYVDKKIIPSKLLKIPLIRQCMSEEPNSDNDLVLYDDDDICKELEMCRIS